MLQFLKFVLATVVGLFLFMILSLFIVMGIASSATSSKPVEVAANSVLKLKFDKPIVERGKDDPLSELNLPFGAPTGGIGLIQVREAIANAKLDKNIKGIYLEVDMFLNAGYASLEEIRTALIDFKSSKKFIIAYGEVYTEKGYYLASVADQIFLNPTGAVEFNGISSESVFLKGTFEKLDIKPEIFRVGEYKSAVEPLFRENMSDASKEQTLSFLNSINNYLFANISKSRNIPEAELRTIADSLLLQEAEDALKYKFVTNLSYYDEVEAEIKKKVGLGKSEDIHFISLSKYEKAEKLIKQGDVANRIAVIVTSGAIQSEAGGDDVISSDKIAETIRKARLDDKVKAIVLRINSPGGSALASDIMWREVILAKKVKPVIASMSDVAASGGYYMAMGCNTIVAHPNTITGSIGVFGVLFNVQDFLKNKLGITVDGVQTNSHANLGIPTHAMTDFERKVIQKGVEHTYLDFTTKAAQGRKMQLEALQKIASGRVWSGLEAKQNGLVDVLGGLDDAIRIAAKAAKLKDDGYRVRYLPEQKTFAEEIFNTLSDDAETKAIEHQFGMMAPYAKAVKKLQYWQGVQARMPFDLAIQ
jgi:protease-4